MPLPPRLPLAAACAVCTTLLQGCLQPLAVTPNDAAVVLGSRTIVAANPGLPGTLPVQTLYYGSGTDRRRPEYRDSITYRTGTVDASPYARIDPPVARSRKRYWGYDNKRFPLNARAWYPVGNGPFPLVLIVHGNHDMKEFSDPGYAWLGELLASKGYVFISVDENFLNGSIRNENDARGWILLKHLEVLRALNDSVGKPLHGRIDMTRIALIGHSRGGEAVAIAAAFNRLPAYPDDATQKFNFNFDIRSLVAIAPVDGQYRPAEQSTPLTDCSYLVIHGSHDGDVSSFQGLTQYNRIRFTRSGPEFKSAIWMYRANHGQWNTVWNNRDNGKYSARTLQLDALIDGEEQRRFGRVVIGGFLDATLGGMDTYRALFSDYRSAGDWLPPTMYLTRYADARTRWLATFDEDIDVSTGSAPGVLISGDSLSIWKENDVTTRSRTTTFRSNAVTIGWNNTPAAGADSTVPRWPARLTITVPDSLRQAWGVDEHSALLLTVGTNDQKPDARRVTINAGSDSSIRDSKSTTSPSEPGKPAPRKTGKDTVPPDFTIEIEDSAGHVARVPLSSLGAVRMPIESYVYRRKGRDKAQFFALSEQVMQTYVAPMSLFRQANDSFDPGSLSLIRLLFDRKPVGTALFDDVGLTRLQPLPR